MTATSHSAAERGFTLIELVAILVIVAILGAMALPRFIGRNAFDTFGFTEQTGAMLRMTHKNAISKRRTSCISLSGGNLTISHAAAAGSYNCTVGLIDPATGQTWQRPLPSGVTLSGLTTLRFNALGQPVDASGTPLVSNQSITISGEFSTTLTVEAETGYVH